MMQYVLKDLKKSRLVVAALWFVYAASYFIRTCYAASIASIVSEGTYNKGEIGLIGTAFFYMLWCGSAYQRTDRRQGKSLCYDCVRLSSGCIILLCYGICR